MRRSAWVAAIVVIGLSFFVVLIYVGFRNRIRRRAQRASRARLGNVDASCEGQCDPDLGPLVSHVVEEEPPQSALVLTSLSERALAREQATRQCCAGRIDLVLPDSRTSRRALPLNGLKRAVAQGFPVGEYCSSSLP